MVSEIKVTSDNSSLLRLRDSFNKRWGISNNCDYTVLKNRCLAVVCDYLDDSQFSYTNFIMNLCRQIEFMFGVKYSSHYDKFSYNNIYEYVNRLDLSRSDYYSKFMFFLEILLNYDYSKYFNVKYFAHDLAEALKMSNANVIICKTDDGYELYPSDVEFLDDSLVFDVLSWLGDYSDAKEKFSKAIKLERKDENYRDIVDNLRLSFESFFREFFNNTKTLEHQNTLVSNYLKDNGVSTNISNMYYHLFDLYTKYNNDNAKHHDNVNEVEVDYLIYLTGSFIRFIILLDKRSRAI